MKQEIPSLELQINYYIKDNKITVLSCKVFGKKVTLPNEINGYPVANIGSYAFSNPEEGFELLPKDTKILTEVIEGVRVPGSHMEYIYGNQLEEIILPESIEVIDRYAFYNCKELMTIHMSGGRIQIEDGAFMNCDKLTYIYVSALPDDYTSIRGILTELTSELTITFTYKEEQGIFLFPEYYEEAIENTPARVFQYQLYGAGYRYRQCFQDGRLNITAYDAVFESAEIQTIHETALRIALLRLEYPYQLHESMKTMYSSYITTHIEEAIKMLIVNDNSNRLLFLIHLGVMSEKQFIDAGDLAVSMERKECASILLKERLQYYPPHEKDYEL